MIRQFAWTDYESVVRVWQATGRDIVPRSELEAKLQRDPELFLVAEAPAAIAGVAGAETGDGGAGPEASDHIAGVIMGTYDGRRGWIFRLAVHPGHRRQGLATRLVAELETRLAALGCPRVNLLVMPDNEAALKFWQSLGYLPCPDVHCTKPLTFSS